MTESLAFRSTSFAAKIETTSGEAILPTSSDFLPSRPSTNLVENVSVIDNEDVINNIGRQEPIKGESIPTGTWDGYLKASGTEGTAPRFSPILECGIGGFQDVSSELTTTSGSTTGTSSARASLAITGVGSSGRVGRAVLIKDATNGRSIRNMRSLTTNAAALNFNLANAPASGVALGLPQHYYPQTPEKTFSAWRFQAPTTARGFHDLLVGCKTTSISMQFDINQPISISASFVGDKYHYSPVGIFGDNKYFDFDDGAEKNAVLDEGIYTIPELLKALESKVNALTSATLTATYNESTKKVTLSFASSVTLLWDTGTNAANTIGDTLGFVTSADSSSGTSFVANNEFPFFIDVTPTYDSSSPVVARNIQLLIGLFSEYTCADGFSFNCTLNTPESRVPSFCKETGIKEVITNSRQTPWSASLVLKDKGVNLYQYFKDQTTIEIAMNFGQKDANGWIAGQCGNIYLPQAKISTFELSEREGYYILNLTGFGFVSDSQEDVHLNFV